MQNSKPTQIIDIVRRTQPISSKEIAGLLPQVSYATVKRMLTKLVADNLLEIKGTGRASRYVVSPGYSLFVPVDLEQYFKKEIDEREIIGGCNFSLPDTFETVSLFSREESDRLNASEEKFRKNVATLTETEYRKDMNRLAIDLSWKSSQIEGNTYSLLETERLLTERETAAGKTKEEAIMLLNHKDALDFILQNPDYPEPLTVAKIENIHSILVKDLEVDRNIRRRRVGITGTNYKPLDNEFQIREALERMCVLVSNKSDVFEKALLVLVLLSYIQAFNDGNKRTARIVSNAVLLANNCCPLSFRTVDSVEYKKAMLLFYEQNNITAFKSIFINQFEFAVNTYF